MKDESHHMKYLNKKVLKSVKQMEEESSWKDPFRKPLTEEQKKKQRKARIKKGKSKKVPHPETPEERNKKLKKKIPFHRSKADQLPKR